MRDAGLYYLVGLLALGLAGVAQAQDAVPDAEAPAATADAPPSGQGDPALERGAYLFAAAGCAGCHTDVKNQGALLAGGRPLDTPFGVFYSPNITPDPETGIGDWSDEDFIRALREGVSPDGDHLYPAFPYTSYSRMTEEDMRALKAYIFSLPPVRQENRPHDLGFPYGWRFLLGAWKMLNFEPGVHTADPGRSDSWNRGAYLVEALGHCGECHTPRDALGGLDGERWLAGTVDGPDGDKVPNITPDEETGIGSWSASQITGVLRTGLLPDGDVVGAGMGEVVENSTSRLTNEDRAAIAEYLQSQQPVANPDARATRPDY